MGHLLCVGGEQQPLARQETKRKIRTRWIVTRTHLTLVEVRTDAARNIAERKELSRKADDYAARASDWEAKAELALTKGREDLARGALSAKQQSEQMVDVVESEIAILDEAVGKADEDLAKLQTKLNEAKAKHKALSMRSNVAKGQIKMRTMVRDTKVEDALARYERMERKVDELEAHVESFDLGAGGDSLESQFAELEANDAIEDELAALKARVNKPKAANGGKKKKAG